MPRPRVLEPLERAVVNGSWTEEWNPEEMPRRGTHPKKAEAEFLLSVFSRLKQPSPLQSSPNFPSYRSQGQTNIKFTPATRKETCVPQEGSGRGKYPPVWDLPIGGRIGSVAEWSDGYNSSEWTVSGKEDDGWGRRKLRVGKAYQV